MKLYLITRTDDFGYDQHISFIVAAKSEESALEYSPYGGKLTEDDFHWLRGTWTTRENLEIECIGESNSTEEKVIHSSFKAG